MSDQLGDNRIPLLKLEKKNIGGRMLPPSPAKRHATPGDYHGCFEKISHFDPAVREKKKSEPEPPNAKIKPNPRGGPGYVDICLNPFPPHSHDPYDQETRQKIGKSVGRFLYASAPLDYFPPNPYEVKTLGSTYTCPEKVTVKMKPPGRIYVPFPKKPGGNHSGCFDKFPTYKSDPYMKDTAKDKKEKGRFVLGAPNSRSKYTNSIINQVTGISCNEKNYENYQTRVYPLHR
ncbi:PREDICTED: UPF0602 protein C4orf47 homolog [Dufourea novaeangliae]|uniref:UPF0602 protein C4orf47 homolog n=1 Tax=Dufourea novaeangliae TaxID=178035 RepID=UPI0007671E31|nr:PREDICTED: UPF0602 protein C4orf47 homolog [Dufourea novaeangliae]